MANGNEIKTKNKTLKWLLGGIFIFCIIIAVITIIVITNTKGTKKPTESSTPPAGQIPLSIDIPPEEILDYDQLNELVEKYAERLKDKQTIQLGVGQNIVKRDYHIAEDVFSCEFRAYRPLGVEVRMKVAYAKNERYFIGYDPQIGAPQRGIPGDYSGLGSNPEKISIAHPAGQDYTVTLELYDLVPKPISVVLEVWETPARPAIMVVLPDSVELTMKPGEVKTLSSEIGESGHQLGAWGIEIELSDLKNERGEKLDWKVSPSGNLFARRLVMPGDIEYYDIIIESQETSQGIYSGTAIISSTNSGKRIQLVKVIVE